MKRCAGCFIVVMAATLACDGSSKADPASVDAATKAAEVVGKQVVGQLSKAKVKQSCLTAQQVDQAIDLYLLQNNRCPASVEQMVAASILSKGEHRDAWGHAFAIDCDAQPRIRSAGPDGQDGTPDDITSSDTCGGQD